MCSGGNLKISGSLVTTNVGTFTPRTGNVEFTGSTQAIPSFNALGNKAYNNLILSGSGTKSFDAATSVTGDLSIANGVKAGLSSANYSAGSLTLGGAGTINGSWGSLSSTATNKTDAYFSGTGILNVTTNTNPCTAPFITVQPANDSKTYGDNASFSVTALGSGTLSYQWEEFDSSWLPVTDGGIYSGATTAILTIAKPGVALSGRKYRVVVTGECNPTAISNGNAILTVTAKGITGSFTAEHKEYDGGTAALVLTRTANGVLGEDVVSLDGGTATFADKNVADGKTVTLAGASLTGTDAANYSLTSVSTTTANITQRAITVTADAGQGKVYGATEPALTYALTTGSLVGSDAFSGSLSRATGENVGTYAIQQGSLTLGTNYDLDFVGDDFTITAKAITVTADDQSKFCGQVNPALTYQITSGTLVNGDSFSGNLATSGESAGTHAINQGSLSLGDNYNITFVSGKFTINGVSIDATASYVNIQINNTGKLSATVSPAAAGIPVTFTIYEDDNTTVRVELDGTTDASGMVTVSWTALGTIGTYKVKVMAGSSACDASMDAYISVFDPSSSFVTGGGWLHSPAGAMPAKPDAAGKANFGFVSKYKKGKNNTNTEEVDGNTEFQFHSGDLNFKSTLHESGSLIVSGKRATYRGSGTINGQSGFKFMVVAIDGDWNGQKNPDSFRIKITTNSGDVVYDNQIGKDENSDFATILGNNGTGGGSIVIHEVQLKGNKREADATAREEVEAEMLSTNFTNYPNTFMDRTTITFVLAKDENYSLEVYDIRGVLVTKVASGTAEAGRKYEYEVDGTRMASGMFIARLVTPSGVQMLRMIKE